MVMTPSVTALEHAPRVVQMVPQWIERYGQEGEEWSLTVAPQHLLPLLRFLRDQTSLQYHQLMDVTAVDYPQAAHRFQVVYQLLSVTYHRRLRVKTCLAEGESLPSVTGLYASAGWWEREVWDMFGIFVADHPDLRRILTDYGFQGHPLRKDFPLSGFTEVRYDEGEKRVVTEALTLAQEFRAFDLASPWEQLPRSVG